MRRLVEDSIDLKNFLSLREMNEAMGEFKNLILDDWVKSSSFRGCKTVEKVKIKKNTKIIFEEAFSNCRKLKELEIEDGLVEIKSKAFFGTNIKKIYLPDTVEKVYNYAFSECGKIDEIRLSPNMKIFHTTAFVKTEIGRIYIPRSWSWLEKVYKKVADEVIIFD